ncbi:MAG: AMIN domain-containing protein, partial [Gemmatimonas sp.]
MMGPTTVAAMAAILAGTALAPAAHTAPSAAMAITKDDATVRGRVRAIEVAPAPNGTAIVLDVDAAVSLHHFTLSGPSRIVVDLGGANLAIPSNYDGKTRGAVRNVRLSQFRTDTARMVIDLDAAHKYTVERDGNSLRINIEAPAEQFARWGSARQPSNVTAVATGSLESPVSVPASSAPADSARKSDTHTVAASEPVVPPVATTPATPVVAPVATPDVAKVETPVAESQFEG